MSENPNSASLIASAPVFLPVPVRARHDGLTPERQREFIEHLADTGCVRASAGRVGVTEQSLYRLRRRAGARSFALAWDAALEQGLKRLAAMAFERAVAGTVRRVFYHGELVHEEVVHSERLLIWLLEKGERLLGERKRRREVNDDWDGWMDRVEAEAAGDPGECGAHRVWQHEKGGTWVTNFPPPQGFRGWQENAPGHADYARTLTREEAEGNARRQEAMLARAAAARDAWFGLAEEDAE